MRSLGVTVLAAPISAIVMPGLSALHAQGVDGDLSGVRNFATMVLSLNQVVSEVVNHNDHAAAARSMAEAAERKIGVQNVSTNSDFEMDDMTIKMIEAGSVSSCRWPESGIMHQHQRSHPAQ